MKTYQTLLAEVNDNVLTLRLNRPDAMNALNALMFDELKSFFSGDYKDYTMGCVIITGSGEKAFAAGADIKELHGLSSSQAEFLSSKGQSIFKLIEEFHLPVIAAVNGFALGGGCELAMACHVRVASNKARFGQPEVGLGIVPGYGGTQRLIQLIGKGKGMEFLLTGDMILADQALALGLVNYVVEPENLLQKSLELAAKMNTRGPLALKGVIKCVNGFFVPGVDGYALEARTFGEVAASTDFVEGTSAFIEKRKAVFTGKLMYEFHSDKDRYFDMQYRVTREHILPFLRQYAPGKKWNRVLEIGCAEAGVLKAFLEEGAFCTGIELSPSRIAAAEKYHEQALKEGRIEFVNRNIADIDPEHDLGGKYDLVILKDVIEHIPGQLEFMSQLPAFLEEGGLIFFGFPPWQMPYGGHQQIAKSKWLNKLPYYHLLPKPLYKGLLKWAGESAMTVEELLEIKSTGISIERFEKCLRLNKLAIVAKRPYLFNPIYFYKFGVKPRVQNTLVSTIPVLRNFVTSAMYYLVKSGKQG